MATERPELFISPNEINLSYHLEVIEEYLMVQIPKWEVNTSWYLAIGLKVLRLTATVLKLCIVSNGPRNNHKNIFPEITRVLHFSLTFILWK